MFGHVLAPVLAILLSACAVQTEVIYTLGDAADSGRGRGQSDAEGDEDASDVDDSTDATAAAETTVDATDAASVDAVGAVDTGSWCVAPPTIDRRFPSIGVAGGYIYIEGRNLASPLGSIDDVNVSLRSIGADGVEVTVELSIVRASERRLALFVPLDIVARVSSDAYLEVATPCGTTASSDAMFFVETTGFGGKTEPSSGLLGNVYKLVDDAGRLPDFASVCTDPLVIATEEFPCPFASLLVPTLDVPDREFDAGFPGLRSDVVEWFAIEFDGRMTIETAGSWSFNLCSDDGSRLYIDDGGGRRLLIDNDGQHSRRCVSAAADLVTGTISIRVEYFQGPRNRIALELFATPPGGLEQIIASDLIELGLEW